MITQTTPLSAAQRATCISSWTNGTSFYGIQQSDLNTASLPGGVTGAPSGAITPVSGSFTIPPRYFGVASTTAGIAELAAAGASCNRIHSQLVNNNAGNAVDYGMAWGNIVANATNSAITFTAPSTVNWSGHGLSNATSSGTGHGITFYAPPGSALPTGLTSGAFYYLVGATSNSFELATSINGSPITFTGSGAGPFYAFGINTYGLDPISGNGAWDQQIAALNNAHMDILVDMSLIPASISVDGTQNNIPTNALFVTGWLAFLKGHYNNTSKSLFYFEVWNEPNTSGSFNGGYTGNNNNLLQYTYMISNAVSATGFTGAQVISPSFLWCAGNTAAVTAMQAWLSTTYNGKTAAQYCNIFAFHPYNILGFCDLSGIAAFITMLKGVSAAAPIWITEVGDVCATINGISRAHLYAAALGVQKFFWYNYDDQTSIYYKMGLGGFQIKTPSTFYTYNPVQNFNPYPGLSTAYQQMITNFAGRTAAYLNYSPSNGLIGTTVNSVNYVF